MLEILIDHGFYQETFDLIGTYGAEETDIARMTKLCSNMIERMEYEEN